LSPDLSGLIYLARDASVMHLCAPSTARANRTRPCRPGHPAQPGAAGAVGPAPAADPAGAPHPAKGGLVIPLACSVAAGGTEHPADATRSRRRIGWSGLGTLSPDHPGGAGRCRIGL